jgi:hypothetical protein
MEAVTFEAPDRAPGGNACPPEPSMCCLLSSFAMPFVQVFKPQRAEHIADSRRFLGGRLFPLLGMEYALLLCCNRPILNPDA